MANQSTSRQSLLFDSMDANEYSIIRILEHRLLFEQ